MLNRESFKVTRAGRRRNSSFSHQYSRKIWTLRQFDGRQGWAITSADRGQNVMTHLACLCLPGAASPLACRRHLWPEGGAASLHLLPEDAASRAGPTQTALVQGHVIRSGDEPGRWTGLSSSSSARGIIRLHCLGQAGFSPQSPPSFPPSPCSSSLNQ